MQSVGISAASEASPSAESQARRVAVVVLGDLGASPRMQFHAHALARAGLRVQLVGYAETPLYPQVAALPRLSVVALARSRTAALRPGGPLRELVRLLLRGGEQGVALLRGLLRGTRGADLVLVQTPPALPTLPLVLLVAALRRAPVVIDWHNFGADVLAESSRLPRALVRLARALERRCARHAQRHLCVSRAMGDALARRFAVREAVVLRDRPPAFFAPLAAPERARARRELALRLGLGAAVGGGRAPLIVCPTSYTADEDLGLLLAALEIFGERRQGREVASPAVVVSGRGRGHAAFEAKLARATGLGSTVRTAWLEPADYHRLLASADLGLCLHRSVSGVDLPMKLSDFFGVGLPAVALDYGRCLAERLHPGRDALLFADAQGLAELWLTLFRGFPQRASALDRLRCGAAAAGAERFETEWEAAMAPLLRPGPAALRAEPP